MPYILKGGSLCATPNYATLVHGAEANQDPVDRKSSLPLP